MQLDKTRIIIRERPYMELLELALVVIRYHAAPLAGCLLTFALPLALLNHWFASETFDAEFDTGGYAAWQVILIAFEAPLATSLMTIYLGQIMFVDHPGVKRLTADFFRALPQLFAIQVILRGIGAMMCFIGLFLFYMLRPYANEVILLERNKISGTWKRLTALHENTGGLVTARWFGSLFYGGVLMLSLMLAIGFFREQLFNNLRSEYWRAVIDLPLALWLVIGFFAVVRYLCYLDLRIRREGWEVELKMRAEAVRLARAMGN